MSHTPGPWRFDYDGLDRPMMHPIRVVADGSTIDRVRPIAHLYLQGPEAEANAHLIAAAPDLLIALNFLLDHYTEMIRSGDCGSWDPETDSPVMQAREAIAKATAL